MSVANPIPNPIANPIGFRSHERTNGRTYVAVQDARNSGSMLLRVRAYQRFNIRCPEGTR